MSYKKLHDEAFVLDSHCDTPSRLMEGADLGKRLRKGHFDYIRMKEGGVDAVFFAIYTSGSLEPDAATRRALQLIAKVYDSVEQNSDRVAFAFNTNEALQNKKQGLSSIFLGMENGAPIQKDLSLLRLFYDMGIRYMTLSHSANNEICDSCAPTEKKWNGLSPFGKEVVREMNRLGMLIDVSHVSDDSFYDVLKYSRNPVVATHSCCRAITNHPRNLTDQMIKDLASEGGVMQINFHPPFLNAEYGKQFWPLVDVYDDALDKFKVNPNKFREEFRMAEKNLNAIPRPSYKEVVDHIDHAVNLVGVRHVGIGSDFDGIEVTPEGLEGADKFSVITKELKQRGYKDDDVKQILGLNFLRLL
jgi:membrane dipeptidase